MHIHIMTEPCTYTCVHTRTHHHYSKRSEVSTRARQRELGSIAGPQVGKHGWLRTQSAYKPIYRFAGFALSCSKVRVGFKSLPIFPIISCCFFILMRDVKHGFLFSGKSTLAILYQFWRTALTLWLYLR